MKTLFCLFSIVLLSGCSALKSIDFTLCSLATNQDVAASSAAILAEMPDGPDKVKAIRALRAAQFTAEHGCETVRAIRQTKSAQ